MSHPNQPPKALTPATPDIPETATTISGLQVSLVPQFAAADIQKAITKISEQVKDSTLRSIVDRYTCLVAVSRANDGEAHFPRGVNPHASGNGRCIQNGYGNIVCFLIGSAIKEFYRLVDNYNARTGRFRRGYDPSEYVAAVGRLKELAIAPAIFFPYGSDGEGYRLLTADQIVAIEQEKSDKREARIMRTHGDNNDVRSEEEPEGREPSDSGGTGCPESSGGLQDA